MVAWANRSGRRAGSVRLFIKGAIDKAREKIKAVYGVDIPDKGVLRQILDTAKQAFGGNMDMAVRSQQVRDLVELYAMSTGQEPTGMVATMRPGSLVQSGGSLFQSPGYANGSALPGIGGLPRLDRIGGGVASGAGTVVIPGQSCHPTHAAMLVIKYLISWQRLWSMNQTPRRTNQRRVWTPFGPQ